MSFRPARTATTALLAGVTLAASLAACSSSGSGNAAGAGATDEAARPADPRVAVVTVTAAGGCTPDKAALQAGPITFKITNKDATAVSEVELLSGQRIVGEKENIPPGFKGEFAVDVTAGTYTLYCPGGSPERRKITVTGASASTGDAGVAALLRTATTRYATYVETQVGALVTAAGRFDTALHGTNLAAAQKAYIEARPFYEKIEPVAESFVIGNDSIDADIDRREGDGPASQWRGFHRIEKALFQQKTLTGMAAFGDKLVSDIKRLQKLTTGLTYQPTELANGAQELLDEVASSKITGEEERYSRIDLLDVANNVEGAEQAFAQLQPAVVRIDPALSDGIQGAFTALDKLVDTHRTETNPSGFTLYNDVTAAQKSALAAAVKAVQEPLSTVASKVANA
jgi:iron uptake system component EfeO